MFKELLVILEYSYWLLIQASIIILLQSFLLIAQFMEIALLDQIALRIQIALQAYALMENALQIMAALDQDALLFLI